MIVNVSASDSGLKRAADVDVSDLTEANRAGDPRWLSATELELPFDPEPSPGEQAAIRRRLLTRDAAEEQYIGALMEARDAISPHTGPVAYAVRLLIGERLAEFDD